MGQKGEPAMVIHRAAFTHRGKEYQVEARALEENGEVWGLEVQAMCGGRVAGFVHRVSFEKRFKMKQVRGEDALKIIEDMATEDVTTGRYDTYVELWKKDEKESELQEGCGRIIGTVRALLATSNYDVCNVFSWAVRRAQGREVHRWRVTPVPSRAVAARSEKARRRAKPHPLERPLDQILSIGCGQRIER